MITLIIPTLNSAKVIKPCLKSIFSQTYKNFKVIIADGGSTDSTLKIVQKFKCQIIKNKLKTGEAGKAAALKRVTTPYVALIDSDNILPRQNWLQQMIITLKKHPQAVAAEPWAFTYRPTAGFIERYSALIGANDPYAFVLGRSDRLNYLNRQWTRLPISAKNYKNHLLLTLKPNQPLPTLGANGTVYKTVFLKKHLQSKYLFDIDILASIKKPILFVKTKNSIIHSFCQSSIKKFIQKQYRRAVDFHYYQSLRRYQWPANPTKFLIHTLFISPFLPILGFIKKPDPAWFFHPLACWLTLIIYASVTIKKKLNLLQPLNRQSWQQ